MILFSLFLLATPQDAPAQFRRALAADTTESVHRARAAQDQFERGRRFKLPVHHGGSGRCDERIGRFCYWYDDGDTTLPADPPAVKQARQTLLDALAEAELDEPANDWVVGQRIRYLIEQDRIDSAIEVGRLCRATEWWCAAVAGLALHAAERFSEAEAAFDRALATMPATLRCEWLDWSVAIDDRLASRVEESPCPDQIALADSVFWLGQPLLSRPGNDLKTESLSRRAMALLHESARSPHGMQWSNDMAELLLRYGWSTRYSVAGNSLRALEGPSVVGHQPSPSFQFFPTARADSGLDAWAWSFKPDRPRSRYAPSYAAEFLETTAFQLARFPRGDTTYIAGAIGAALVDPGFRSRALDVALAVSGGPGRAKVARTDSTYHPTGLLVATGSGPVLASLETNPHGLGRFLRARTLLAPIDRSAPLTMSDPLLFEVAEGLPGSLEEAAGRMLPTARVSKSAAVGVYWEVADHGADSLAVSISLVPGRRGLLGRIGQGLSLVGKKAPLTIEWRTGADTTRVSGRAIELDLRQLKNGKYRLVIEVASSQGRAATERNIELVP